MPPGVDDTTSDIPGSAFTNHGLQYGYDAELAAVLPFNKKIPFDNVTEARRVEADAMVERRRARAELPPDTSVIVEDRFIDDVPGSLPVPVRTYTPARRANSVGALVFFHGGGYMLGTPDDEQQRCAHFAARVGCIVVSVDYRLAPENPFPAALDDCYRAVRWVARQEDSLGIDPSRIAVGGISSGGGLAASVAQRARDEHGPRLALQLLVFPTLDSRSQSASMMRFTDTPFWDSLSNRVMWEYYLPASEHQPAYAAPALATSFADLPPAMLVVAEFDPLHDEALHYTLALLEAKVSVELHLYPGTYHAFDYIAPFAQISQRALADQVNALAKALRS